MTVEIFLALLLAFSVLASLVTEAIKKLFSADGNITAFVVAIIVGLVGTLVYYQLGSIDYTLNNVIYAVLMGLASSLTSQLGYDKIKEAIQNFNLGGQRNAK